jgi:hypothetical protein
VKDWQGIFAGDEALAAAILDRLLYKSVVLNIKGRGHRLHVLEKLLKCTVRQRIESPQRQDGWATSPCGGSDPQHVPSV